MNPEIRRYYVTHGLVDIQAMCRLIRFEPSRGDLCRVGQVLKGKTSVKAAIRELFRQEHARRALFPDTHVRVRCRPDRLQYVMTMVQLFRLADMFRDDVGPLTAESYMALHGRMYGDVYRVRNAWGDETVRLIHDLFWFIDMDTQFCTMSVRGQAPDVMARAKETAARTIEEIIRGAHEEELYLYDFRLFDLELVRRIAAFYGFVVDFGSGRMAMADVRHSWDDARWDSVTEDLRNRMRFVGLE